MKKFIIFALVIILSGCFYIYKKIDYKNNHERKVKEIKVDGM